jgi:outer membrane immunogenic protein
LRIIPLHYLPAGAGRRAFWEHRLRASNHRQLSVANLLQTSMAKSINFLALVPGGNAMQIVTKAAIGALAFLGVSAAHAADEVAVTSPEYTWSGFYLGAHAGYGWGNADYSSGGLLGPAHVDEFVIFEDFRQDDGRGFIGGVQAGYNWQTGNLVYGFEADAAYANVKGGRILFTNVGTIDPNEKLRFLGTIRGRLGYSVGRFLPYVTAGMAVANYKLEESYSGSSNTHVGWAVGLGSELAVTEKVSLKLEYLYADFGKKNYDVRYLAGGYVVPLGFEPTLQTVRLGVNVRF